MALKFIAVVLIVCAVFRVRCDPCTKYQVLNGDYRSINYAIGELDLHACDSTQVSTGHWYLFQDDFGNNLTLWNECVELFHCGTVAPIWLAGGHPTDYNVNQPAQVCATYVTCNTMYPGLPNGCAWNADIQIRRCSDDTYRYQLRTPPCPLSYCAGDAHRCSDGFIWLPDGERCIRLVPEITRPEILPPEVETQPYDFSIKCAIKFTPVPNNSGVAFFDVVFLFNGVVDESTSITTNQSYLTVGLYSAKLDGHIGKTVQCEVKAFWEGSVHKSTSIRSSNGYYIGILIYHNTTGGFNELDGPVSISKASVRAQRLYMVSTIPLTCPWIFSCFLRFTFRSTNSFITTLCNVSLRQEDWDDKLKIAYHKEPFLLTATKDPLFSGEQTFAIEFDQFNFPPFFGNNIWDKYTIPAIQVQYTDQPRAVCISTRDTHITTFDGSYYHVNLAGVFRYVISQSRRVFEVQVKHYFCLHVTCNCAVIVREGNTILGVDACDYHLHRGSRNAPRMIQYSPTRERGAAIYSSDAGRKFTVCMPSGACVRLIVYTWGVNVFVDGIEEDFKKVKGLCGTFNSNRGDDFTTPAGTMDSCPQGAVCNNYSNKWLVDDDQNLFKITPATINVDYDLPELCKCVRSNGQEIHCRSPVQQNTEFVPEITRPEILPPEVEAQPYDFSIKCAIKFTRDPNTDSGVAYFDVVFLFNGVVDESTSITTNQSYLTVGLYSAKLDGHIGKTVQCEVKAFWEGSVHKSTSIRSSNGYYVGILIYHNTTGGFNELDGPVSISEASVRAQRLYMVSTIPLTCPGTRPCFLRFTFRSTNGSIATICNFILHQEDWDDNLKIAYHKEPFLLTAARDPLFNGEKTFAIEFDQFRIAPIFGNNIWDEYTIPAIQVQYTDQPRAECRSTGDPHITTFDGSYYHVYVAGVFRYVISQSSRVFEVQVKHYVCSALRRVTCNCAVIVREGNTILGVDACDYHLHRGSRNAPRMIQYSPTRERGAAIYSSDAGRNFAICMPSGACVRLTVYISSMSVFVDGIEEDFGKVKGLCGTFNGNKRDDFTTPAGTMDSCPQGAICNDYSNKWLVDDDQNLFKTTPATINVDYDLPELCDCVRPNGQEIHCGPPVQQNTGGLVNTTVPEVIDAFVNRPGRSTGPYTDYIVRKLPSHPVQKRQKRQATVPSWPTQSGITEERANELCRAPILQSTAYAKCHELFQNKVFEGVPSCVEDMKILDDVDVPVQSAVDVMEAICKKEVLRLERTDENEGTSEDPRNILHDIEMFICPSQCSGHGQCVNGTCSCNTEYIGADCSVQRDSPPTLNAVESDNNGTCDVRQRPCRIAFLVVDNVVNSDNIICKISPVQYDENGQRQVGEAMNVAASVRSRWEMTCSLPETPVSLNSSLTQPGASVYGFMVSVSNDGNTFSSESELTIFDSVCQSCDSPENCVRQDGSCVIDGHCFESGEINPANNCEECMPQKSLDSWSIIAACGWSAWSGWGKCNPECGYGLRTRERTCLSEESSCEGSNMEQDSCNLPDCKESPTASNEGLELVFEETLANFLATKVSLLKQLLITFVNNGCGRDPAQCCRMAFLVLNRLGQTVYNITSDEFVDMTRIFEEGNNRIRTKWILKIDGTLAEKSCRTSSRIESRYIDQQFLLDAVTENKERIEQVLDIQLVSIEKSETVTTKKNPKTWVWWVVGCGIAVVVLALVVISVIAFVKKKTNSVGDNKSADGFLNDYQNLTVYRSVQPSANNQTNDYETIRDL